jgi:murein L,D-transpeptidase YafK
LLNSHLVKKTASNLQGREKLKDILIRKYFKPFCRFNLVVEKFYMLSRILFTSSCIMLGTSLGFQHSWNRAFVTAGASFTDTSLKKIVNNKKQDLPPSPYHVVIDKSDYEMNLYDEDGWLATYPVVFGSKDQEDKKMEGDRLTPEGTFRIVGKKIHKQWGKFLMLDYPTPDSYDKFNERKAEGLIPRNAHIGGGIGIHGTRPNEEWVIDKFVNWTSGCISVRYSDIDELYDMLPIGTEVVIQK